MKATGPRVALFLVVGLGFLAFWARQESGWLTPLPDDDPLVLGSFSGLLAGLGASLLQWSRHQPFARAATIPAAGAFSAAAANLLEDGLGLEWAFFAFLASTVTLLVGQVALAARSGRDRAFVPALSALALGMFPLIGGPLMALAWATAAWQARSPLNVSPEHQGLPGT